MINTGNLTPNVIFAYLSQTEETGQKQAGNINVLIKVNKITIKQRVKEGKNLLMCTLSCHEQALTGRDKVRGIQSRPHHLQKEETVRNHAVVHASSR